MIPIVRNTDGVRMAEIDNYISFIWTERFYDTGDFEIVVPITEQNIELLKRNNYIQRDCTNDIGIIEKVELNDNQMIVSGRFLTSILGRRIVENQTEFRNKSIYNVIERLILDNFTNPDDLKREIPIEIYNDTEALNEVISTQYTGDNILKVLNELAEYYHFGFKIIDSSNRQNLLTFQLYLYEGTDRSGSVIFSNDLDNLKSIKYCENDGDYVNAVLVAGEGEGKDRKKYWGNFTDSTGLNRYEVFKDARNISSNNGEITHDAYYGMLKDEAVKSYSEFQTVLNADVFTKYYKYREDFKVGDKILIKYKRWGIDCTLRIVEITETMNDSGEYAIHLTFAS